MALPSRSLGDSGKCKRKTLVILFPPGYDEENEDLFDMVAEVMATRSPSLSPAPDSSLPKPQ